MKKRSEVLKEDKWNVEALYPSMEAWEKDFARQQKKEDVTRFLKFQGRLSESLQVFKEALELKLAIERELEKLYTYAHLRHDEEITENRNKAAEDKISSLISDFNKESAWFEPEILAFDKKLSEKYLLSKELSEYRFYIEKILRLRPHTLSSDKEALLAMAAKPLKGVSKAFSALNNADIKFNPIKDSQGKEHPLSHALYNFYLRSSDRVLRKNAFFEMHAQYFAHENTLAELLYSEIQKHIFVAKARGFRSSLEAALFPHNIPLEVYSSLIKSVRAKLPLLHRYVSIRKAILNLPDIHLYDMYAPLVKEVSFSFEYEEAENVVIDSVACLGSEYQGLLKNGLREEKWVDKYENLNKRSGAYSSGCYDSFPYILMNYRKTLRDVFTLAHEAGHSMQTFLSRLNQPYHLASYPIFVAEVASTFNEELLHNYLLKKEKNEEASLFLINEKIEDIRATFFRQTMFAEFELKVHELCEKEIPLTPTLLKEIYLQLNKDYFGPAMEIDEVAAVEWARIPHFYYNFYVYQYATGLSAALSLTEKVLQNDSKSINNYLTFLKMGGSLFPIDLLKVAGIDMTQSTPVERILRKFEALLTQLEALSSTQK